MRIPRALLHLGLDDLLRLGIADEARQAMRSFVADLPLVPDATSSAQLIGPPHVSLPCLAVVARHVGQGLRDANLAIAHDRVRLRIERLKLIFLPAADLNAFLASGDQRPALEAVLFVSDVAAAGLDPLRALLQLRESAGLVSFVTATMPLASFGSWRTIDLGPVV